MPDPRALIFAYLMLASGILAQREWTGMSVSLLLTAAILWPLRRSIRPYAGAVRAYAIVVLILSVTGGLSLYPAAFRMEAALDTLQRTGRLLIVMLLGLPLLALIPPFRLQRAADQLLAPLSRCGYRSPA